MTALWLSALGLSLVLTELFEGAAALCAKKRGTALAVVLLVNLLTNPPAVLGSLAVLTFQPDLIIPWIIAAEAAVVAVEAMIYRTWRESFPHPWQFSLLLNLISFSLGLVFQVR